MGGALRDIEGAQEVSLSMTSLVDNVDCKSWQR